VEFGVSVTPLARELDRIHQVVRTAEETGLELVGIQDHPYAPAFLDTMALIGVLLGESSRVRLFPNVANLPLRPPAILAKAAASLDLLSGGRFELGLGGGGRPAVAAMGGPQRSPGESVEAVREAIDVLRAVWSGRRGASLRGRHYFLEGLDTGPAPAHPISIWLGSMGPRMLRMAGELADGWSASIPYYLPYERVADAQSLVDEGARAAGREPRSVLRICNIPGTITDLEAGRDPLRGFEPLRGTAERWIEVLSDWAVRLRFDVFILWPEAEMPEQVERFAREVAPGVRAAVANAASP